MRIFVTGATGFVGRWLRPEFEAAGHEVIGAPPSSELPIGDTDRLREELEAAVPDAIVHLAAVSFAPDAAQHPARAIDTNVTGTSAVFAAAANLSTPPVVLVVSSSEVYGAPDRRDLPLTEHAPIRPRTVYAVTKLGQEAVTLWAAARYRVPAVVIRPFNHTGPGQRPSFAVPAFVERALVLKRGEATEIRAGNLDVQRDIGDVRDVVRAYRLLAEQLAAERPNSVRVFNVATGRGIAIRTVLETVCELAGVEPIIAVDPSLVRADDPPTIVGAAGALTEATGWTPRIPLRATLADMVAAAEGGGGR